MTDSELAPEVQGLRVSASSVSECELECLRADVFICRSFSYRYDSLVNYMNKQFIYYQKKE